jgi:hypothetical protein
MTVDHDYVSSLLNIAEKCTGHSGKLSNLQSWAIGELIRVNAEIKEDAVATKHDAEAKAVAEADQKASGLPEEPGDPDDIHTADNPNPDLRRV